MPGKVFVTLSAAVKLLKGWGDLVIKCLWTGWVVIFFLGTRQVANAQNPAWSFMQWKTKMETFFLKTEVAGIKVGIRSCRAKVSVWSSQASEKGLLNKRVLRANLHWNFLHKFFHQILDFFNRNLFVLQLIVQLVGKWASVFFKKKSNIVFSNYFLNQVQESLEQFRYLDFVFCTLTYSV